MDATAQTNLRFFPQGSPVPTAANLNPTPGAPPTPNAVTVGLNDTNGMFSVFNKFGVVAVVIDVVGYYDDHNHDDHYHDDHYYAKAQMETIATPMVTKVDYTGETSRPSGTTSPAMTVDVFEGLSAGNHTLEL